MRSSEVVAELRRRFPRMFEQSDLTPEEQTSHDAELAEHRRRALSRERWQVWSDLIRQCGRLYLEASFKNYRVTCDEQREVVESLAEYAHHIAEEVAAGRGIVLTGPSGTGKDHLLLAVAREAVRADVAEIEWINGQDLFAQARDLMNGDDSEGAFVRRLIRPQVLILSDPLPLSGSLTDFQTGLVYRIVDGRYRACRATWVSMNVDGRQEAEERLGVAIVDRLRDGALAQRCNWPSFRKPLARVQPEKGDSSPTTDSVSARQAGQTT